MRPTLYGFLPVGSNSDGEQRRVHKPSGTCLHLRRHTSPSRTYDTSAKTRTRCVTRMLAHQPSSRQIVIGGMRTSRKPNRASGMMANCSSPLNNQ